MRFEYYEPATIDEACSLLAREGDAGVILAGGTDVLLQLRRRQRRYDSLINIKRLGLNGIGSDPERGLTVGALTTFRALETSPIVSQRYPSLVEAARVVAGVQLRNLATVGGNLGNASPAADSVPPLVALGATATITGPRGTRTLLVEDCFAGPGKTVLAKDELITALHLPPSPPRSGTAYQRFTPRSAMDIAIVSAAAYVELDQAGHCQTCRIALGAVAPVPLRVTRAEELARGEKLTDVLLNEISRLAGMAARPIGDIRGSADYRRALAGVLVERTMSTANQRAQRST